MTELIVEASAYVLILHRSDNVSHRLRRSDSSVKIEADEDAMVDSGEDIKYCAECFSGKSKDKI